jgi:hypothetical protein
MKTNFLTQSNCKNYSFAEAFNAIILDKCEGYNGNDKEKLKSFFEDLQHGGCISGIIGDFIYNDDCKNFYVQHIDDLEEMKEDLENNIGEPINNRNKLPHYTFVVWLCFEEYCYDLYNTIFEN